MKPVAAIHFLYGVTDVSVIYILNAYTHFELAADK